MSVGTPLHMPPQHRRAAGHQRPYRLAYVHRQRVVPLKRGIADVQDLLYGDPCHTPPSILSSPPVLLTRWAHACPILGPSHHHPPPMRVSPTPGMSRALLRVGLQSTRGSLPPSLFQNRACRFPGTRLLSDTPLVMGTLPGL